MNSIKQTKKAIFPVRVDWEEQVDVLWCTEIERYGLGTRDIGRYSLGTRCKKIWPHQVSSFCNVLVNSFMGGNALLLRSCYKESNHYNVFGSTTYCSEESHRNNRLEMMLI